MAWRDSRVGSNTLAIAAGFLTGCFVIIMLDKFFGIQEWWLSLLIAGCLTVLAEMETHRSGYFGVTYGTAIVGAYFFMRGWTLLWGSYPNEAAYFWGTSPGSIGGDIYLYLGLFVGVALASGYW